MTQSTKQFLLFSLLLIFTSCSILKKNKTVKVSEPIADQISTKEAVDFEYLYLDAVKDKMLGNHNLAINKFSQAMRINPRNAAVHYEMSNAYFALGNLERAISSAEFSVKYDSKNKWYKINLAELYMQGGKAEKALPLYQQLVKDEPNNADYIYNLASIYSVMEKYDDAAKTLDKLEGILGINPETTDQKKNLYLKMNKTDKAIKEVEKLVSSNPAEGAYLVMLADLYSANNMEDKAMEVYKRIIEVDSSNAMVYFSLADFYREKQDYDQSFIYLKKAFENPFASIDAKMSVLMSFYDLSDNNEKLKLQGYELCEILIKTHPDDAKSYSVYGDFLVRDERYAEARDAFKQVLETDKSRYAIWNQIILLESELNNTQSVYDLSKEAIELFPYQPTFFLFNGISALQLKKYQEAVDVLKDGLVVSLGNKAITAQMHATMGDAYNFMKKYKESGEAYEKSLKIDPNNTYVLNNYSYYLSLRKENLDRAKVMAEKANVLEPNNSSYLDTYAWVLFQANEYDKALIWIQKAIDNGGSKSAVIMEHKGDIYYKLGEIDLAIEWWNKALEKDADNLLLKKKINEKKYIEELN
jgi:tetratricopeptide (TPR) repeat protein